MDPITPLLISKALDGLHARQIATAENIANAGTPSFRPLRVDFETSLRRAASGGPAAVALVSPTISAAPDTGMTRGMRLDLEVATASQTALRYAALIDLLGRQMAINRAVVSGGR